MRTRKRAQHANGFSLKRACRDSGRYAQRRCLRCEAWFRSSGAGHRLCDRCTHTLRYAGIEEGAC